MLPRDIVTRCWRPITKCLALPGSSTFSFASFQQPPTAQMKPARSPIFFGAQNSINESFNFAAAVAAASAAPVAREPRPVIPVIMCPTPLHETPQQEDKAARGERQHHGNKKHHPYLVRHNGHNRSDTLELARIRRGPETPTFPDGVPFERIRKQHHLAGYGFGAYTGGRKHKMYFSLKRGR